MRVYDLGMAGGDALSPRDGDPALPFHILPGHQRGMVSALITHSNGAWALSASGTRGLDDSLGVTGNCIVYAALPDLAAKPKVSEE